MWGVDDMIEDSISDSFFFDKLMLVCYWYLWSNDERRLFVFIFYNIYEGLFCVLVERKEFEVFEDEEFCFLDVINEFMISVLYLSEMDVID